MLTLHCLVVVCIPSVTWLIAFYHPVWWMIVLAIFLYIVVQLPIMVYACSKQNNIYDRIISKILEIKNRKN